MRFAVLFALLLGAAAQQGGRDPLRVCRRHKHQTCIIDSKLYIDGGLAYYGGSKDNNSIAESNTYLLWEDVSNKTALEDNFPIQYSNLTKDPDVPSVSGGVLWPDTVNKLFYLFGGEYEDSAEVTRRDSQGGGFTLWYYDTIYDSWNKSKRHGSQDGIRWPALGAGAVSDTGDAYYYGGYLTNTSDFGTSGQPVMLNGLITYNMDTRLWTNQTWDRTPRAEGVLHYLPASEGGMLAYFGGLETDEASGNVSYANMSQIHLYDIANPRWYTQTATGDIPSPRRGFCAGVIWAKDKSSYNIYLYGGFGGPDGAGLGDVYILTIPSFQWIHIWPIPQEILPNGKGWTSCNVFRDSQMIVMGGLVVNNSYVDCDVPAIGGQHGMLLGQENVEQGDKNGPRWWHAPMGNVTEYRVPDQIVARIGGDTEGNAASTVPAMGWATLDLAKYLGTTFSAQTRTTMSGRVIPTAEPTTSPSPSKTNTGAIVGGAIGGAIGLIAIIAGVVFCLRRRRRNHGEPKPSELGTTPNSHNPDMAQKATVTSSVLHGSTLHSPSTHTYSPQGSPPPASNPWHGEMHMSHSHPHSSPNTHPQGTPSPRHFSADWGHDAIYAQGGYPYHQTYYPPPPEPSTSPMKESHAHSASIELPNVRSPTNVVAEMAEVRSPAPKR